METRAIDATVTYNQITATEATYGITVVNMNGQTVTVIWGTPGNLLIYVTDGAAGIPNAFIAIWNGLGALTQTGETNGTGYYNAGAVALDNYTIQATEPGYGSEMNTTLVTVPQIVTLTLAAAAGGGGISLLMIVLTILTAIYLGVRH